MLEKPRLALDVEAELADERFLNRKHGSRATHSAGCHGPLCRRAETLRGRRRTETRAEKENREYIPSRRMPRDDSRDLELSIAFAWHCADLAERRLNASLSESSLRAPEADQSDQLEASDDLTLAVAPTA